MCRPKFISYDDNVVDKRPLLDIKNMVHPLVYTDSAFIPNDTLLGGDNSLSIVVTGANMGGKVCIIFLYQLIHFKIVNCIKTKLYWSYISTIRMFCSC